MHLDDTAPTEVDSLLPQKPCPPALENLDILHQICLFIPRHDLKKCLYVSRIFHLASSRIYYTHVSLTSGTSVLKLLKEKAPARITRQHAKKPITPLAFLQHTSSITIGGDLHLDHWLPHTWLNSLVEVFPNVRNVKIIPLEPYYAFTHDAPCWKDLWILANQLGANVVCVELKGAGIYSSHRTDPYAHDFWAPSVAEMPISRLDTLVFALSWPDAAKGLSDCMKSHPAIFDFFQSFQVLLLPPRPVIWTGSDYIALKLGLERHPDSLHGPHFVNLTPRQKWSRDIPSVGDIAESILSLVKSHGSAKWTFYNLADHYPKEASWWPATVATTLPKSPPTSVSKMVNDALLKSTPNGRGGNLVTFKTRADYLLERRHPFEIDPALRDELEADEKSCDRRLSGLNGTWEL